MMKVVGFFLEKPMAKPLRDMTVTTVQTVGTYVGGIAIFRASNAIVDKSKATYSKLTENSQSTNKKC